MRDSFAPRCLSPALERAMRRLHRSCLIARSKAGDKHRGANESRIKVDGASARFVCAAMFVPCFGARDEETAQKLSAAFKRGDSNNVRTLRRNSKPDDTCWCAGKGWWLSTALLTPNNCSWLPGSPDLGSQRSGHIQFGRQLLKRLHSVLVDRNRGRVTFLV